MLECKERQQTYIDTDSDRKRIPRGRIKLCRREKAADEADRRYTMEAEAAGDAAEDHGIARRQPALAAEPHLGGLAEVA